MIPVDLTGPELVALLRALGEQLRPEDQPAAESAARKLTAAALDARKRLIIAEELPGSPPKGPFIRRVK